MYEGLEKARKALEMMRGKLTDAEALKCIIVYPVWDVDQEYKGAGENQSYVRRGERLFKCRQSHTSQAGWEPENAPALWEEITLEPGTHDNPIHYNPGMALEKDLYYTEDGTLYICIRDTGIPVYNFLSELIGIYVEESE